jgi:hypothetical protein
MDLPARFGFLLEKSLSPWLAVWVIRSKWNLDYRLSSKARFIRWGTVFICYSFSPRIDVVALQICGFLIGLTFLCWPNVAYYLIRPWPVSEGRVTSSRESDSRWSVAYCFEFNGQRYGGHLSSRPFRDLSLEMPIPKDSQSGFPMIR